MGEGRAPGAGQRHRADAVKKNAALAEKPLNLVLALLEAYPRLGRPLFPRNTWRQSLVGDEFTGISQEMVGRLLRSAGPCPLDELGDIAYRRNRGPVHADGPHRAPARLAAAHDRGRRHDRDGRSPRSRCRGPRPRGRSAGLTDLGRYAIRRVRGMAQPGDPVLQMRVTLADVDGPPVWRQVVIPAGYTLDRVHGVIQAAMGWQNSHLHMFRIAGREYGPAYLDDELETLDEKQFRIGDLVKTGDLAGYEYDFGDGWEHELAVEASAAAMRPRYTRSAPAARARARPRTAVVLAGSPTSRSCSPVRRARNARRCAHGPVKNTTPRTSTWLLPMRRRDQSEEIRPPASCCLCAAGERTFPRSRLRRQARRR